jgi:hypothetical protein
MFEKYEGLTPVAIMRETMFTVVMGVSIFNLTSASGHGS